MSASDPSGAEMRSPNPPVEKRWALVNGLGRIVETYDDRERADFHASHANRHALDAYKPFRVERILLESEVSPRSSGGAPNEPFAWAIVARESGKTLGFAGSQKELIEDWGDYRNASQRDAEDQVPLYTEAQVSALRQRIEELEAPRSSGGAPNAPADRLRAFVREQRAGGCRMPSWGTECICPLCDVDRLVTQVSALRQEAARLLENEAAFVREAMALRDDVTAARQEAETLRGRDVVREKDAWHEDFGPVLWWLLDEDGHHCEAPYVGTPLDDDFPDYVTHFSRLPLPVAAARVAAPREPK